MTEAPAELLAEYGRPVHPLCNIFPLMSKAELAHLEADILGNGLASPVVIHEGQIVDGRNRLLACVNTQTTPRFVEWSEAYQGKETLARWIWSVNAERRHLTVDQYVAAQVTFMATEEREAAKVKQVAGAIDGGKSAGRGRPKAGSLQTDSSEAYSKPQPAPQVRAKMAKNLNVSEHKVQQALNVQKTDPELLKQVAQGNCKLVDADKKVKESLPVKDKPAFDVEKACRPIMRLVDQAIKKLTDKQRRALLKTVMETLEKMF